MKFTDCRSSVAFFSVVVLVIVNGHPTTDVNVDKQHISELISVVAELRAELTSVKDDHAKALARISKLAGKFAATVVKLMRSGMQITLYQCA